MNEWPCRCRAVKENGVVREFVPVCPTARAWGAKPEVAAVVAHFEGPSSRLRGPKFCSECGAPLVRSRLGVRACSACGDTIYACACKPFVQIELLVEGR